jgi:hypothetical protein
LSLSLLLLLLLFVLLVCHPRRGSASVVAVAVAVAVVLLSQQPKKIVISTEAGHGLIVSSAAEKPLLYQYRFLA